MENTQNKLRVVHFAQVPCKPFTVEVKDEYEAYKIINVLADQHLFLFKQNIIPDYSNVIYVEMFEDGEWVDYWNDVDWDEFVEQFIGK